MSLKKPHKVYKRWLMDILWNFLLGATFFVCIFITYQYLLVKGIICSNQSKCFDPSMASTEQLFQEECSSFCNTKECIDISQQILKAMNQSANPCEDFNNFVCGNYFEKFKDTLDQSLQADLVDELALRVREVLEEQPTTGSPQDDQFSAGYKARVVYQSCIDRSSSDFAAAQSVVQYLNSLGLENWPELKADFTFDNPTLGEVLGRLAANDEAMFLDTMGMANQKDEIWHVAIVAPSTNFEDPDAVAKIIDNIFPYIGVSDEDISKIIEEFNYINTEFTKFKRGYSCDDDMGMPIILDCMENELYMPCQIAEAYLINRKFSILRKPRIIIDCMQEEQINNMTDFLSKKNNHRAVANYLAVTVFLNNLQYMGFSFDRDLNILSSENMFNVREKDTWKYCVKWIMKHMKFPLGSIFVSRYWRMEASKEMNEIVKEILHEMKKSVPLQRWIGEETKQDFIEALDKAQHCMDGIIKEMRNQSFVDSLFETYLPTRSSFMHNVFQYKKFLHIARTKYDRNFIDRYFIDSEESLLRPFTDNAYGRDDIYLSFGGMSSPFYHFGYPHLFNLAKIGQIIAHELGHTTNYFFERLEDTDNQTLENYKRKLDCLVKQYSKFEHTRIQKFANSELTIPEDIADSIGLTFSEKAAEPYFNEMQNKDFILPGLSYTPEQLLYISNAQVFCAARTLETEKKYHPWDDHSPPEFRIIGPLQNSERFSKAFNCPSESYMNPNQKCIVFE